MVEPGEYNPEIVLLINGFNSSNLILSHSFWLIPCINKFGLNEGDECIAIISPV